MYFNLIRKLYSYIYRFLIESEYQFYFFLNFYPALLLLLLKFILLMLILDVV